jgi:VCBS repeat-containing protein
VNFDYSQRIGTPDSQIAVYWGGQQISVLNAASTGMKSYTLPVSVGADGTYRLEFKALDSNGGGGVLDNIQVQKTAGAHAAAAVSLVEVVTPAGNLTASGSNAFSDVDLTDTHVISAIQASAGALGSLTASVVHDTTGTGSGGQINWNYSVDATKAEYLATGQTKVETFTFTLSDGHGGSVDRTVNVTLTGTNDAPVLSGTQATLAAGTEDTVITISKADLLAGYSDVDATNTLSVVNLSADHGTVVTNADGSVTITPAANYNGALTLSYGVSDGTVTTAASLSTTLAAVNDAPLLNGDTATLAAGTEDTAYIVTTADLLTGWSDVEGSPLSVVNLVADTAR